MILKDRELGEIHLVQNTRSKQITVRYKDNMFQLSYPLGTKKATIEDAIKEMKPRLLKLKERIVPTQKLNPSRIFSTFSFQLEIKEAATSRFQMILREGVLQILCPLNTNFEDTKVQDLLKGNIENVFRNEAKRLFPAKVKRLAETNAFSYAQVKINKSNSRWGSCSGTKNINLSYFCMLLPEYLVDFIILHELCHTIEMNHSERFWNLLDKVSNGQSKALTLELKSYKTSW